MAWWHCVTSWVNIQERRSHDQLFSLMCRKFCLSCPDSKHVFDVVPVFFVGCWFAFQTQTFTGTPLLSTEVAWIARWARGSITGTLLFWDRGNAFAGCPEWGVNEVWAPPTQNDTALCFLPWNIVTWVPGPGANALYLQFAGGPAAPWASPTGLHQTWLQLKTPKTQMYGLLFSMQLNNCACEGSSAKNGLSKTWLQVQILFLRCHFHTLCLSFSNQSLFKSFNQGLPGISQTHQAVSLLNCFCEAIGIGWGAPATLTALWKLNDAATMVLSKQLYENLLAGVDPAVALGQAQRFSATLKSKEGLKNHYAAVAQEIRQSAHETRPDCNQDQFRLLLDRCISDCAQDSNLSCYKATSSSSPALPEFYRSLIPPYYWAPFRLSYSGPLSALRWGEQSRLGWQPQKRGSRLCRIQTWV